MRSIALASALLLTSLECQQTRAEDAHLHTSFRAQATLSDNVRLAPRGDEETDLYFQFTPSFDLTRRTGRLDIAFNYSPTLSLYPFTEGETRVSNNLRSLASARIIDDFLFLDASVNTTQSFVSPFSQRQSSDSNLLDNQTEQTTFAVSPYIRGVLPGGFTYLARNDLYWTTNENAAARDLIEDHVSASLDSSKRRRTRIGFDYSYHYTKFESEPYYYTALGRARPGIQIWPNLLLHARVGYERNNYASDRSGPIYGAGIQWSPTPRTALNAFAEHRFFGTGYNVDLAHRTRLTVWRLTGSRDSRTYREQGLTLQPGLTDASLNEALIDRLPDNFERQQAIERILASAGLPPVIDSPFTFLSNQPYLSEHLRGSVALVARRNTATLYGFWQKNEPIVTTGAISSLPDVFVGVNNFTQRGAGVTISHTLSGTTTLTLDISRTKTTGELIAGAALRGFQPGTVDALRLSATRQITPKTYASAGARWVEFKGDLSDYTEHAVYISLQHHF